MIQVTITYYVPEIEDKKFRPLGDIARDVEGELWDSPLFSEASFYKIIVEKGDEYSVIEYQAGVRKGERS